MMHLSMMMAVLVASVSSFVLSREGDSSDSGIGSSSYYTDEGARRLVHFDGNSGECRLFGDRRIVEEILHELAASESPVAIVEAAELTAMISRCAGRNLDGHPSLLDFPHVIYPGTKWCGSGNAAVDLEDLGPLRELDICCRNHDLCPEVIESGESKHNLTNETPFAVTRCDCSENFRSCLKAVGDDSSAAREVGTAYFSSGLFQCFMFAKPVSGCLQWKGLVTESCQKYSFKEEGEQMHQFFDMSSF